MNHELYYHGYEAGKAICKDIRDSVMEAYEYELPEIAGQKIGDAVKHSEIPFVRTNSWQTGCFDGFMEQAEKMRGTQ